MSACLRPRARTCALSPGSGCSVHRIRTPRYAVLTPEARDRNSLARHGLQSTRTSGPCAAPPSSPLKSLAVSRASRNAREGGGGEVRHFRMRHANTFRLRPHKPVTGARWGKQPGRMSRQSRTRPTGLVCGGHDRLARARRDSQRVSLRRVNHGLRTLRCVTDQQARYTWREG